MAFAVDNSSHGWFGWYSYQNLKDKCEFLDEQTHLACEAEDRDEDWDGECISYYQADSPYAEFITGYDTDTYADTLCSLISDLWEFYKEECEEEGRTPTWDEGWEEHIWADFDYQLCHTWLRVTNIHNESDEEIKQFAKECDYCTLGDRLGI